MFLCLPEPAGAFVTCPVLYNFLKLYNDISDLVSSDSDLVSSGKNDCNRGAQ